MGICSVGKTANICWERRVNRPIPQVPSLLSRLSCLPLGSKALKSVYVNNIRSLLLLCYFIPSGYFLPGETTLHKVRAHQQCALKELLY